jgi:hypothetical protein
LKTDKSFSSFSQQCSARSTLVVHKCVANSPGDRRARLGFETGDQ